MLESGPNNRWHGSCSVRILEVCKLKKGQGQKIGEVCNNRIIAHYEESKLRKLGNRVQWTRKAIKIWQEESTVDWQLYHTGHQRLYPMWHVWSCSWGRINLNNNLEDSAYLTVGCDEQSYKQSFWVNVALKVTWCRKTMVVTHMNFKLGKPSRLPREPEKRFSESNLEVGVSHSGA